MVEKRKVSVVTSSGLRAWMESESGTMSVVRSVVSGVVPRTLVELGRTAALATHARRRVRVGKECIADGLWVCGSVLMV